MLRYLVSDDTFFFFFFFFFLFILFFLKFLSKGKCLCGAYGVPQTQQQPVGAIPSGLDLDI